MCTVSKDWKNTKYMKEDWPLVHPWCFHVTQLCHFPFVLYVLCVCVCFPESMGWGCMGLWNKRNVWTKSVQASGFATFLYLLHLALAVWLSGSWNKRKISFLWAFQELFYLNNTTAQFTFCPSSGVIYTADVQHVLVFCAWIIVRFMGRIYV